MVGDKTTMYPQFLLTFSETFHKCFFHFISVRPKELKISQSAFIPKFDTVFDFMYEHDECGTWVPWINMVKEANIDDALGTGQIESSNNRINMMKEVNIDEVLGTGLIESSKNSKQVQ